MKDQSKFSNTEDKALLRALKNNFKPNTTSLSKEDTQIFFDALENPPEPNEALKKAMKRHNELIDQEK
ncbi:DUF1778 domain-containing protein [Persicobacter psychrovividus]